MIIKKDWDEFRNSGLLWYCNTILQVFGWSIIFEYDDFGKLTQVYPARTKFRGFSDDVIINGCRSLSQYMVEHAEELKKESE